MDTNNAAGELKNETIPEQSVVEPVSENKINPESMGTQADTKVGGGKAEKTLQEMLEKNLKWSQIIYEQNRRISRRLLWTLIIGWMKWVLIAAVIVLSIWYAWPIYRTFQAQYSAIVNQMDPTKPLDKAGLEKVLQMLPLNSASQEQIKALLK